MSDYDNGYARAAAMYDRQEPPDNSLDRCECGETLEEHLGDPTQCMNCGFVRALHPVTAGMAGLDGPSQSIECSVQDFEPYDGPRCPEGSGTFREPDQEPDPDRARDEAIDRAMDPPEDYDD